MSLITIKKSYGETDLLILKSRLESAGIKCHLKNELTTQILNPAFEVELQVSASDLDKVQKILSETKNI